MAERKSMTAEMKTLWKVRGSIRVCGTLRLGPWAVPP